MEETKEEEEDTTEHELQEEEKQEQKTNLQEETEESERHVSKKDMDLQLALERNRHLEREFRMLEDLKKMQDELMSHKETENAALKEEKRKKEMELLAALEKDTTLEKECKEMREMLGELKQKLDKKEMELQWASDQADNLKKSCKEKDAKIEKHKMKSKDLKKDKEKLQIEMATLKGNQKQDLEHKMLLAQLKELNRIKDEEKAKLQELKRMKRNFKSKEEQLKETMQQLTTDKEENETLQEREEEMREIQRQLESLTKEVQNSAERGKKIGEQQEKISCDLDKLESGQQVNNIKIQNLCEGLEQVLSMYEGKIKELRQEMVELTSTKKLQEMLNDADKNTTIVASDQSVLLKKIRPFFVYCVHPLNVLPVIHAYDQSVLVEEDIQEIQCAADRQGNIHGATVLLSHLVRYKGWLSCIVNVLRDPKVKLNHVADQIKEVIENLESDEHDSLSSEVKTFFEEMDRHTSQEEELQKSRETHDDEMKQKDKHHKSEIEELKNQIHGLARDSEMTEQMAEEKQRQQIEIKKLTDRINLLEKEKEKTDKEMEQMAEEKQRQQIEIKKLTDRINLLENEKEKADKEMDMSQVQTRPGAEASLTETPTDTGFSAQTSQKLPRTGYTMVIEKYITLERNNGGHFNPVTGFYTVPSDGRYRVTFSTDHHDGHLWLHHVKVSNKSDKVICDNNASLFDNGLRDAKLECDLCKGETLYLEGMAENWSDAIVNFAVSYLG